MGRKKSGVKVTTKRKYTRKPKPEAPAQAPEADYGVQVSIVGVDAPAEEPAAPALPAAPAAAPPPSPPALESAEAPAPTPILLFQNAPPERYEIQRELLIDDAKLDAALAARGAAGWRVAHAIQGRKFFPELAKDWNYYQFIWERRAAEGAAPGGPKEGGA